MFLNGSFLGEIDALKSHLVHYPKEKREYLINVLMLFVYNYYSKDEMIKVTDAIHELMGEGQHGKLISAKEHVDKVFETMDSNQDGKVTIEEFLVYCNSNQTCRESLTVFP